ncbi:hypothetical protein D3C83_95610 [compost metagenome]
MVDDHAVAVDPQLVREEHGPARGRHDRRAGVGREIEPEVRLLVDVASLVDVGASIGERRLDRGVGEGMKDDTAEEELG